MKKLLFVFLLFKSSITFAEWTFVGESPDKSVKLFITKSTTQQISQYKRVWTREEFSSNSEMSKDLKVRSARHLEEYDCRGKKMRLISYTTYKKPNLTELYFSDDLASDWRYISPKTVDSMVFDVVCNKK
jgi:hypothetical protein